MIKDHYCYNNEFDEVESKHFIETDLAMESFNALNLMKKMVVKVNKLSKYHRTNHLFITWGCDNDYNNAQEDFRYLEVLIDYLNKNNK